MTNILSAFPGRFARPSRLVAIGAGLATLLAAFGAAATQADAAPGSDARPTVHEFTDKVREQRRAVRERQEILDRELRNGDPNRISRAKQKLDKAAQELLAVEGEQGN
ncbi:DUF1090 family protein [Achromobacter sp. DH1f]|uniref:DUF1090 family protein n=1 Tax=Achromobacter sp. DH1f TaxID=1397275 RepID=UPI0004690332|nr:DUF1090 family protein [Achromobacter sp. DH1f]